MNEVSAIINTKYPRSRIAPGSGKTWDALEAAWECIQAALRRKSTAKTATCDVSLFRGTLLRLPGSKVVPFINIADFRDPFLGIFPKDLKGPQDEINIAEPVEISFRSYSFTDSEMETMNKAMPYLEPLFDETIFYLKGEAPKIPAEKWAQGMDLPAVTAYLSYFHPLILDEISNLALSKGELICDPACGTGGLLEKIKEQFPQFKLVGSDIHETLCRTAKRLNPSVPIYLSDACKLSYLDFNSASLFIFCGLLNWEVLTRQEGEEILKQAILKTKDYGYIIITGKTPPLFNFQDLIQLGFWPLLTTKWKNFSFFPFYVCLTPRKTKINEEAFEATPIASEIFLEEK